MAMYRSIVTATFICTDIEAEDEQEASDIALDDFWHSITPDALDVEVEEQ